MQPQKYVKIQRKRNKYDTQMKANNLKRKVAVSEDTVSVHGLSVWSRNDRLPSVGAAKVHKTEIFEF